MKSAACCLLTIALVWFAPGSNAGRNVPPRIESPLPAVAAKAWLLMDYHSGWVLGEKDADQPVEPASLTKLMTAYVVYQELQAGRLNLDHQVLISEKAWRMPGSRMFVPLNAHVRLEDLLKGMIIQSGNDAAVALAEHVAGTEEGFAKLMNRYAEKLELTNTHFVNSTGLSHRDQRSSARDLSKLARVLIRDFPEYYGWHALKEFTYNDITQHNRNGLLWRDPSIDGVKTGHTRSAGYSLIGSAERDGMRLIATVLGADSEKRREREVEQLLEFGFRAYETRLLYRAATPATRVRIVMGAVDTLPLGLGRDLYVTLPRGTYDRLEANLFIRDSHKAPIKAGQRLGNLTLKYANQVLGEYSLIALEEVAVGSWWQKTAEHMRRWFD